MIQVVFCEPENLCLIYFTLLILISENTDNIFRKKYAKILDFSDSF